MKKIIVSFCLILLLFSLISCKQEAVNNKIITEIGQSIKFGDDEINQAIEAVEHNFEFPASTLTKIWYDEKESDRQVNFYLENGGGIDSGIKSENIIVLLSNFDVDGSGDNPVLNPNSTYENYLWILIREGKESDWKVDSWGY